MGHRPHWSLGRRAVGLRVDDAPGLKNTGRLVKVGDGRIRNAEFEANLAKLALRGGRRSPRMPAKLDEADRKPRGENDQASEPGHAGDERVGIPAGSPTIDDSRLDFLVKRLSDIPLLPRLRLFIFGSGRWAGHFPPPGATCLQWALSGARRRKQGLIRKSRRLAVMAL